MTRWVWPLLLVSACGFSHGTIPTDGPSDAAADGSVDAPDSQDGPFWNNIIGAAANGNSLTNTAADGWNNSGASTREAIIAVSGYLEFSTAEADRAKSFGLSNGDSNQDYTDIDFAFQLRASGQVYVHEGGLMRGVFGTYSPGDRFRIEVNGGVVTYKHNDVLLYTSSLSPTFPLVGDAALLHTGATITDVAIKQP